EADKFNLTLVQPRAELALQEGNTEKARQVAIGAETLADRLGDPHSRAIARYVEALVDIRLGQFVEADGVLAQLENLPYAADQDDALFRANVIYYRGVIFVARGQFVEAEAALLRARDIYKSTVGASHPILARVLHNLALVHQELGDPDEAQAFYNEAVRILSATFGEESVQVANTRLEAIQTDWMVGQYEIAERSARDAIRIVERAGLSDKRLLATAYTELGMTLKRRSRLEEALPPLLHGIELAEEARGSDALQLTVPLLELAELRGAQLNFADAMKAIERAEA